MNPFFAGIGIFVCILGSCCAPRALNAAPALPEREVDNLDVNDLPAVGCPFKVGPYVRAAAVLQKMGKVRACDQLVKLAKQGDDGQIAILCRMLFSKKANTEFRRPRLGSPIYLG